MNYFKLLDADMRIVAGTAGMPAELFLPIVRNQIIMDLHK